MTMPPCAMQSLSPAVRALVPCPTPSPCPHAPPRRAPPGLQVARAPVRAQRQQRLSRLHLAGVGRPHERGAAVAVALVHLHLLQ